MQHFTGKQYLMIDIASSFGFDKLSWDERLSFVRDNEDQLESLTKQAEEPAQYMAGVLAYRKMQRGEATGYLCGLDATASGLQLLALLAGCEKSAAICNLVNTGKREDAYTTVYEATAARIGSNCTIPRKDVKQALMTALYGSKKVPKEVFGEGTEALASFYTTVEELLPGAWQLNQDLIGLWQNTAYSHNWVLPDGFDVVIKVMDSIGHIVNFMGKQFVVNQKVNMPKTDGLAMGANIVHSLDGMIVREMNRRCNYTLEQVNAIGDLFGLVSVGKSTVRAKDLALLRVLALAEETEFLSAVVIEHLDEHNFGHLDPVHRRKLADLINSMPDTPFPVLCVHDCFKFHPNYGNDVRQQYINILAELADSQVLSSIASQVTGRTITVNQVNNGLSTKIRESEYAIC